ncbi:restriction endonuclease subunit S [Pseudomonas aeruginosa]|nr:restriction endonuclease subunit S [Pseudomonas aeruginosa]MBG4476670.1 restriction endonuclease subunit S [Pseudomonas aeruginosa]
MSRNEKRSLVPRLRFPEFQRKGEWKIVPMGSLLTRTPEYGVNAPAVPYSENLPTYLRITDINDDGSFISDSRVSVNIVATDDNYLELGDIVLARTGASVGKSYRYRKEDGQLVFAGFLIRIRPEAKKINPIYLANFLTTQQYWNWVGVTSARSGQPGINGTEYSSLPVPVPSSGVNEEGLFEQQKIADCLSSLDDLIAAETQKLDTLATHKKSLMQQLFPREGETVPRLRFPEFCGAAEWAVKELAEVCNVLQGYGFPEVMQGRSDGKYPFCKVSDISRAVAERGSRLLEAANYVDDDDLLKLRAKLIPKGTTVFAKIGEALRLNRRAYVQKECLIDNNATGLKAIDGISDDYFIYLLSQLIDLNKHCGGAVPSVNKSTLEEIEVIVPGLDEQKKISKNLSYIDDLIGTQSQKIDILKVHKNGLMQQLFPAITWSEQ